MSNLEFHNDIGHGKNTYPPNKGVPGLPEFEFNNAVCKETKRLLQGILPTFEAQPFDSNEVSLKSRTDKYLARWPKNKLIAGMSSHANASNDKNVRGFGVFYWHNSKESLRLAKIVLDEYKKEFPDRKKYPIWGTGLFASKPGTWTDFHMLRETSGKTNGQYVFLLIEWEFMTNADSLKLLKSDDYRKRCAKVKAKSICKWHNLPFEKPKAATPTPTPATPKTTEEKVFYRVIAGSFVDRENAEKAMADLKKKGVDSFIQAYKP